MTEVGTRTVTIKFPDDPDSVTTERKTMKGNNSMILNKATMIEAVQEWLDKRMPDYAPEVVTNVTLVTNVTSKDYKFEIVLNERTSE